MIFLKNKKGFTLIEILIAASLFVIVTTMTTLILFDIITTEKRTNILNAVYDDARVVMEQITTMIHENAIDYDEYYSVNVIQPRQPVLNGAVAYGMYNGVYSSRFYDPGLHYEGGFGTPGTNPEDLGAECSDDPEPDSLADCEILYKLSKDKNTGKNPYEGEGSSEETSNAFCDENMASPMSDCADDENSNDISPGGEYNELFLINSDGTKKTIIATQLIKTNDAPDINDTAIGLLELDGIDSDRNGVMDIFTCSQVYTCDQPDDIYLLTVLNPKFPGIENHDDITELGIKTATRSNRKNPLILESNNFIPITPFRSTVEDLKFIITPVEDPYKAYAEIDMQAHPSVKILLTMKPSKAEKDKYPGQDPPSITIQRTVTAGVHGKVESYPPTSNLEWISSLIPSS
jgi:prepilin-type N-terminal cleavage/methylation domain-containing protein